MQNSGLKVISASRRVDMVSCYPELLSKLLKEKTPPEKVHTLVLWTKNPENILNLEYLNKQLKYYSQLYIHLSITGMGNTLLEPNIPDEEIVLGQIPELIKLVKSPVRIAVRFDPVVHLKIKGKIFSNLDKAEKIIGTASSLGIKKYITSWMSEYPKVLKNLEKFNISVEEVYEGTKSKEYHYLKNITDKYKSELQICSTEPFDISKCIDGLFFNKLHPEGGICSENRAKGQRNNCGCTESWDVGWYYPCPNGCIYCYANPKIKEG
ncbi:DUF1848 family protein [candidate division KSB1 bacterium]